ncbi:metal ABC transporter ATP-binding protein [Listeria costaricensis]|uniref:metal ABC transporter ATP-binding protein n=1 Tax=Listeria costaricensis TaxID=2026604 RepID=UPI000C067F97|nr:metal ABC transporter ATP-binding protein [Listeria costaricensis]
MAELISVNNLSFHYDKEEVLKNIHLSVEKGSFTGLIGPNGSGKSTLLKLILGLLKMQQGEITIFGQSSDKFKEWERIGFVSQKANAFNSAFPASVKEVVASGLTKKKGLFKMLNKEDEAVIRETLAIVGMERFLKRNIGELSGGQQQRVFIARSLVSSPDMLILDEPTVGVDIENVRSFYELLQKLHQERGLTLLLVTHDQIAINQYIDQIISINQRILFEGSRRDYQLYLEEREIEARVKDNEMGGQHCDCHTVSL